MEISTPCSSGGRGGSGGSAGPGAAPGAGAAREGPGRARAGGPGPQSAVRGSPGPAGAALGAGRAGPVERAQLLRPLSRAAPARPGV